ncbi:patatin [Deltaproteobacteria bacterium]|nr:patatin [Deltaproteobacteria bacterium]
MLGLILAGGGARGAYEAGVLRFVFTTLAKRHGIDPNPDLISGTSVGALNGAWVGARGAEGASQLWEFWQHVTIDQVYNFSATDFLRRPSRWLERTTEFGEGVGIFDPTPLYRLIRASVPWAALHDRIDRRELRAFMVSATDVASGRTRIFTDGDVRLRRAATCTPTATRIGPEHCLASAAIPFVFPGIRINGRYFVDGALRQNTPLSPAVEAGVNRALVIGVKRLKGEEDAPNSSPTPAFLAGKALNALLLDPIEENIRRIDALNDLMVWGQSAYPDFMARLNAEFKPYQIVKHVFLRPSEDLGRMAAHIFAKTKDDLPWAVSRLLGSIAGGADQQEADLMSYLFFDHRFTATMEELGYQDAAREEEQLVRLFTPPPRDASSDVLPSR